MNVRSHSPLRPRVSQPALRALLLVAGALALATGARAAEGTAAPSNATTSPPAKDDEPMASSGGGRGGMAALGFGALATDGASYQGSYSPDTVVDRLRLSSSVYRSGTEEVALAVTAGDVHLAEPLPLPDGGAPLTDLYDFNLEGRYTRRLDPDRQLSVRLRFGSASDRPFSRWDVMTIGAGASLVLPGGANGRWVLSVDASNNNPFLNYIPIPGVAYLYRSGTLSALLGFPFATVRWRPAPRWSCSALVGFAGLSGEVAYGDRRRLQGFATFTWGETQPYLPAERTSTSERLFLEEKRAAAGLRVPIFPSLSGELQAGYAFGRSMFETTGAAFLFQTQNPRTDLGAGLFAGWNFRWELF